VQPLPIRLFLVPLRPSFPLNNFSLVVSPPQRTWQKEDFFLFSFLTSCPASKPSTNPTGPVPAWTTPTSGPPLKGSSLILPLFVLFSKPYCFFGPLSEHFKGFPFPFPIFFYLSHLLWPSSRQQICLQSTLRNPPSPFFPYRFHMRRLPSSTIFYSGWRMLVVQTETASHFLFWSPWKFWKSFAQQHPPPWPSTESIPSFLPFFFPPRQTSNRPSPPFPKPKDRPGHWSWSEPQPSPP